MAGLERFNSPAKVQRIGNDSVYGTGSDGTVVIASNTSLSRDMYYSNLTINNGSHLNTNGFRVFVQNTATINGSIGINANTVISTGTIRGTTAKATSSINAIGGSAAGGTYTASQIPASLMNDISTAVLGLYFDSSGNTNVLTGGAGGQDGSAGTVTNGAAGTGATNGGATSGAHLSRNALVAGGPGTNGTPGTNGAAGTTPPAAAAGVGAIGGGVVILVAKNISGSGSILSLGSNGTSGGSSATGSGATNGAAGPAGAAAPTASLSHYVNSHAHYITGDGTHGPHTSISSPVLPRSGHVNASYSPHAHGYWATTHHGATPVHPANHHTGSNPHHGATHTGHATAPAASSYFHKNSVDHTAGGHLGHDGAVAHTSNHTSPAQGANDYHQRDEHDCSYHLKGTYVPLTCEAHRARQDRHGQHHQGQNNIAGTNAHVGHALYPGGSAGSAGSAGTNGTNGSTTAGTFGASGGGGGIIFVTDTSIAGTLTVSASGGTANSASANSGMITTILNA